MVDGKTKGMITKEIGAEPRRRPDTDRPLLELALTSVLSPGRGGAFPYFLFL